MTNLHQSFSDFERAGWENIDTVSNYAKSFALITRQSIPTLLDDAGVQAGLKVLDVATGPGYVAAAAFERGAETLGIDFAAAQVNLARHQHPLVQFEQADAEALPFESETFDAVVCAFGMCHLPNPDLALREAYRVLKKGGRISFSVWDMPERAIGIGAVFSAIQTYGSLDIGLPVGPNFFLFSDPEQSIKALREAGFATPIVRQAHQVLQLSEPDQLFDMFIESSVRAGATLRAQSQIVRNQIRAALRAKVTEYQSGDHFEVPMPAIVASAIKL